MKNKNKKILSILCVALLLSVGLVYALNTEVSTSTKIIYGMNAASSDKDRAMDINNALTDAIITSNTVLGDESLLIRAHGNDLNLEEALNSIITKLTYKNLPGILADGKVEYDDGSFEGYMQKLYFNSNTISFKSLDEEDYIDQDSSESSKQTPVPYLDLSGNLWNLVIEFDDPLDATDLYNDAVITIAGKEYHFAPDTKEGDTELVFYDSTRKVILELNQPQTFEIGGEDVTLEIIGADTDDEDTVFIKFGDDLKKVRENKAVGFNGEKIYVNDVFAISIPEYKVTAELFIGTQELALEMDGSFNNVEVNGKTLEGIEAKVTGSVNATEKIEFRFAPTEMDDIEDELQYLEIGESIIDPLFGTISLFFDSMETEFDSEARDLIELKAVGDELELTFTNVDGDGIEFVPYYVDNSNNLKSNLVSGDTGFEDQIFIISGNFLTEVFKIKNIGNNNVKIYSYSEDDSKDYKNGSEIEGDTGVTITFNSTTVTFSQPNSNILRTENKMKMILNANSIDFDEVDLDSDESSIIPTRVTMNVINDSGNIEIGSISGTGTTPANDDNDLEYTLTNGHMTYFVKDDDNELKVYVPEEEVDFNVYISDAITTSTLEEVDLTIKDNEISEITDEENIIVVGGPCINNVAATLLKGDACAGDFTLLTGVSDGQYLYQVFDNPHGEGIAILIAGYNAEDTNRGVKEFLEGDFSLNIGTKNIN